MIQCGLTPGSDANREGIKQCISQKLREIIEPGLAETTDGRDWLIKALHPSDPITEVRGIPDESACPTTLLNWQSTTVIAPQAGATGTWAADVTMIPDPCMFGRALVTDTVGPSVVLALNSQLGNSYVNVLEALFRHAERWRLAYMGVTIYQDGPTLADQGTVCAAQVPVSPELFSCAAVDIAGGSLHESYRAIKYQAEDVPDFTKLQQMPNAYFSQSKYGVYMPLKLSTNHQAWHSQADSVNDATGWTLTGAKGHSAVMPGVAVPAGWPYDAVMESAHYTQGDAGITAEVRCMPCNENWAHACFQNMSVGTRLVCYWRVGFEIQAHPDSTFSPYLRLSPPYDRAAITAYYKIARELKDGYPADYNDLGKLWDVIKGAARKALPIVGAMGPFGAMAAGLGSFLLGPEKAARKAKAQIPRPSAPQVESRDRPPAAVVEAAQKAEQARDFVRSAQAEAAPRLIARRMAPTKRRPRTRSDPKKSKWLQPIRIDQPGQPKTMVLMLRKPKQRPS